MDGYKTSADPSGAARGSDPEPEAVPVLAIRDLVVRFQSKAAIRRASAATRPAVDHVSLDVHRAESLGLVGESGCGKTTLGRAALGLIRAAHGSILLNGNDITVATARRLRQLRRAAQIIFQDPGGSLSPRMRIADTVAEPLHIHRVGAARERRDRAIALLERCGLPSTSADRYPHQLSGGQRQRVAIARALALQPALIVCDEPTSALDVSVQAQILNLLAELQEERGLSYLFISHDIATVAHLCRRIAVMREGKIVEAGPTDRVLESPANEYTRDLLRAVPARAHAFA
jgi:ABC-type glutathione transport system ATPase component